jgi:arylsulfatase A-like enzyme
MLDLLGLPPPDCIHGRSLVPAIERAVASRDSELDVDGHFAGLAMSEYGDSLVSTFQEGSWKVVSNPDREAVPCMQGVPTGFYPIGETELYDLASDPGEQLDLSISHPEEAARLRERQTLRRASLCAAPAAAREAEALPDDVRRQLEELGYVVRDG